MVTDNLMKKG